MDSVPVNFDPHNPASWFLVVYVLARVVSHVAPPESVVGRICAWVLGQVRNAGKGTLLVLALAVASPALADSSPQFGACTRDGKTCVGPRVAAPAMSVDLKTGDTQFGVLPGFGYGVARGNVGASAYVTARSTDAGLRACPSATFDAFGYVHAGVMWQPGSGGGRAFGILTLGTDLGAAK